MKLYPLLAVLMIAVVSAAVAQDAGAGAATAAKPTKAAAKADGVLAVGRGYLKICPESEALWKQMGQVQSDLRTKEWELFTLLNAEPIDKQAVATKTAEARDLNTQTRDLRDKLKTYWMPMPAKALGAKGAHHKHNQAAPAATPAATAAPAAAPAPPPAQ